MPIHECGRALLVGLAGVLTVAVSLGEAASVLPSSGPAETVAEAEASESLGFQPVNVVAPVRPSTHGRSAGSSAPSREAAGKSNVSLLSESFEGNWPVPPWTVAHPEAAADVDWGRTDHRASGGSHSLWCAGGGGAAPGAGGNVPAYTESWAIAGPFDLGDATTATLSFELWMKTEAFTDLFMWLASTDGETFSGEARSTDTGGWQRIRADMRDWRNIGDLSGEPFVWIAFVYRSDRNNEFEGAYIDNVSIAADSGEQANVSFTYSSDADFETGTAVGTEIEGDELRLSSVWSALPYLWVPNPETGTVSKVSTVDGAELARYRTGPAERELEPSAVVVDLEGSCWVANRAAGTVVKIGLEEHGACVDRSGDGAIETSSDDDEDGNIAESEILEWGADECVVHELSLVGGEATLHSPGESHDDYADNDLQALAVDAGNALWVGAADSRTFFRIDVDTAGILETLDVAETSTKPYHAVVDADGHLWSSSWPDSWVLQIDPETLDIIVVDLEHGAHGLGIDAADHLFVTGFDESRASRLVAADGELDGSFGVDWQSGRIVTTSDGNLWIAAPGSGTVKRYTNDGVHRGTVDMNIGPTGLAVDANGLLWVTGSATDTIYRVNPNTHLVDFSKILVDAGVHDGGGDMTGIVARNVSTKYGTWKVEYDSGGAATPWGTIWWNATVPDGAALAVEVRSSDDQSSWSAWEQVGNGVDLVSTPAGQYLEIAVAFQNVSASTVPVLHDLTVASAIMLEAPEANFTWTPTEPEAGETVNFADTSSNAPAAWSWSFGDGATSNESSPAHVFVSAGTYEVDLEVSNEAGSDSVTKTLTVGGGAECSLTCFAQGPESGTVDANLSYGASVDAPYCEGSAEYSWTFGDGGTATGANPTYSYGETGSYTWQMVATIAGLSCTQTAEISILEFDCASTTWVPVVSRDNGEFDSVWRSDVGLLNTGDAAALAELMLHGPESVTSIAVEIPGGGIVDLIDVVDLIDPGLAGSGALEICSESELIVTSRTYNQIGAGDDCMAGGSFGQYIDGVGTGDGLAAGETAILSQLRENASFRTNIGVTNTGSEAASVRISLLDSTGAEAVVFDLVIEAGQWIQEYRPFAQRASLREMDAGWAKITVNSGDGILVYASVIDTTTNDATTVPMRR